MLEEVSAGLSAWRSVGCSGKNERSSSVRAADGGRVLFEPQCPPSKRLSECVRLAARTECGHRVRKKDNPVEDRFRAVKHRRRGDTSYFVTVLVSRLGTRHAGTARQACQPFHGLSVAWIKYLLERREVNKTSRRPKRPAVVSSNAQSTYDQRKDTVPLVCCTV